MTTPRHATIGPPSPLREVVYELQEFFHHIDHSPFTTPPITRTVCRLVGGHHTHINRIRHELPDRPARAPRVEFTGNHQDPAIAVLPQVGRKNASVIERAGGSARRF